MTDATPFSTRLLEERRKWRTRPAARLAVLLGAALALALAAIGPARLIAQIEGERGIAPLATTTDIQVGGIEVDVSGKNGDDARLQGWKLAQRKAWEKLGGAQMSDGQIDAMVSAVVIEHEQIGPRRYVARLGVIFDRAKAGQYIGSAGGSRAVSRSAPMLVIPVLYSGGTAQVFEVRGPWQRAWAGFQASASPIDYVRASGAGGDSLLLTAGQPGRRSRLWWRTILDQFNASDVLVSDARLERQWPGGPVRGTFTARYGPDNTWLGSFALTANDEAGVPKMLDDAVRRMDGLFSDALAQGLLRPDPTLNLDQSAFAAALAKIRAAIGPLQEAAPGGPAATPTPAASASPTPSAAVAAYTIQFASPDAAAVDATLSAVRGTPGVQGAATTSIAIGGTSVMRVTYAGDSNALAAALRARGFQVGGSGSVLTIRR
ncbi:MAG: heavy-metal-associated domain-containing protein [Novosphingobium sp.]|nr:heavy-metal-associated domain-containing protein [Novosphingobium sp.]